MRTGIVRIKGMTWKGDFLHSMLGYGVHYGFGYPWMPDGLQRLIVRNLNWLDCRLRGHVDMGFGSCSACCHPLPEDPELMRALRECEREYDDEIQSADELPQSQPGS